MRWRGGFGRRGRHYVGGVASPSGSPSASVELLAEPRQFHSGNLPDQVEVYFEICVYYPMAEPDDAAPRDPIMRLTKVCGEAVRSLTYDLKTPHDRIARFRVANEGLAVEARQLGLHARNSFQHIGQQQAHWPMRHRECPARFLPSGEATRRGATRHPPGSRAPLRYDRSSRRIAGRCGDRHRREHRCRYPGGHRREQRSRRWQGASRRTHA